MCVVEFIVERDFPRFVNKSVIFPTKHKPMQTKLIESEEENLTGNGDRKMHPPPPELPPRFSTVRKFSRRDGCICNDCTFVQHMFFHRENCSPSFLTHPLYTTTVTCDEFSRPSPKAFLNFRFSNIWCFFLLKHLNHWQFSIAL